MATTLLEAIYFFFCAITYAPSNSLLTLRRKTAPILDTESQPVFSPSHSLLVQPHLLYDGVTEDSVKGLTQVQANTAQCRIYCLQLFAVGTLGLLFVC